MASASRREGPPVHGGRLTGWLEKIFDIAPAGLHWPRAVVFLDIALVPLVLFWAIGHQEYLLSALFGALMAWFADPGGSYGQRVTRIAVFGLLGAGLTALGFGIGGDAWGWLVLAAFAVSLATGLAIAFGARRYAGGALLNVWFIIALALASGFHHQTRITSYTWAQTLAWAGGVALWVAVTFIEWLIRGRRDRPQPVSELPGDTSRRNLTPPVIAFAVIRALVVAGTIAIAYGASLSHGVWLVIGAVIAMQPSLGQSVLVSAQRVAGAAIGAVAAILVLLIPANETGSHLLAITLGLEVVAVVLLMHGIATRFWNYAVYTAAIAAGALILIDLPQPANYSAEGYRVLWTLCSVAIAVLVMLLASLLGKRRAGPQPREAGPGARVPAQRPTATDQPSAPQGSG